MKTINEKIDHLFSKINWADSNLDAEAISVMNTIKHDIGREADNVRKKMDEAMSEITTLKKESIKSRRSGDYRIGLTHAQDIINNKKNELLTQN